MATKLKIAKEELAALYAHSGRQRAALKAAREALAAAGMAGAVGGAGGLEPMGQGLDLGELERGAGGEDAQLGFSGLSQALPRQTPVQPSASAANVSRAGAQAEEGGEVASPSEHVHFAASALRGSQSGAGGRGSSSSSSSSNNNNNHTTPAKRVLRKATPQRAAPLFGSPIGGGGGQARVAVAEGGGGSSGGGGAALAAALDALATMEDQKAAAEEVGECLTAFLLKAAWGTREALKQCVLSQGEGKAARAALSSSTSSSSSFSLGGGSGGGEGEEEDLEALLGSLPLHLPGGWVGLERGLTPLTPQQQQQQPLRDLAHLLRGGLGASGVAEASLSLLLAPGQQWHQPPSSSGASTGASAAAVQVGALRVLYSTLLLFLRRLRDNFSSAALAVLPEEEVTFSNLLAGARKQQLVHQQQQHAGGGGMAEALLKGPAASVPASAQPASASSSSKSGASSLPEALGAAIPEAELFAALLRKDSAGEGGRGSGKNAYVPQLGEQDASSLGRKR
jgi:hypothetical protein